MQIKDAAAIVAGGGSGLGAATAQALAKAGAKVAVLDRNGEAAAKVADSFGGVGLGCDITSETETLAALEKAAESHGTERILVNCAGIGTAKRISGRDGAMPQKDFEKVVQVNLFGSFNLLRLSASRMMASELTDSGERGVLIMTASVAAFDGQLGQAAYAASKAGVVGLTLPAARELTPKGIRVVTIAPGLFSTPLLLELPDEVRAGLEQSIPAGRLGWPEEYASMALSCIENSYLSGETIRLDGALRLPPR